MADFQNKCSKKTSQQSASANYMSACTVLTVLLAKASVSNKENYIRMFTVQRPTLLGTVNVSSLPQCLIFFFLKK